MARSIRKKLTFPLVFSSCCLIAGILFVDQASAINVNVHLDDSVKQHYSGVLGYGFSVGTKKVGHAGTRDLQEVNLPQGQEYQFGIRKGLFENVDCGKLKLSNDAKVKIYYDKKTDKCASVVENGDGSGQTTAASTGGNGTATSGSDAASSSATNSTTPTSTNSNGASSSDSSTTSTSPSNSTSPSSTGGNGATSSGSGTTSTSPSNSTSSTSTGGNGSTSSGSGMTSTSPSSSTSSPTSTGSNGSASPGTGTSGATTPASSSDSGATDSGSGTPLN